MGERPGDEIAEQMIDRLGELVHLGFEGIVWLDGEWWRVTSYQGSGADTTADLERVSASGVPDTDADGER